MNRREFLNDSAAVIAAAVVGGASATESRVARSSSLHSKGANEMTPNRLTRDNAVLLLVDHQVGLYTGIRDIDILTLKHNIVGLTKAMLALKVPVIVTTTSENMWGPLIPELADVLRGVKTIERTTVNAWDEKRVADAVKATGRKKLIVTGISTDVCLAFPAMAALADGFESYAVIDASGGFTQTQVDMGILRMQQAGVVPVGYSNVSVEILADNAAPEATAVYSALGMPFSGLVFGLRQYYSRGWVAAPEAAACVAASLRAALAEVADGVHHCTLTWRSDMLAGATMQAPAALPRWVEELPRDRPSDGMEL